MLRRGATRHLVVAGCLATLVTLLLIQGVSPRVVMEILGHSQIALTMNTYSHVIPALQREAASKLEALLKPVPQADQG